jgi:hypothetical protein
MRFLIHVTPDSTGWSISISKPDGTISRPRHVNRCGSEEDGFPVPEAPPQAASYTSLLAGETEKKLREAYRNIMLGDPGLGDVERFGSYLSASLLVEELHAIKSAAENGPVELELQFETQDVSMHRLPWEMMYGPDGPLASSLKSSVAIFRRVYGKEAQLRSLTLPLKVLFVVGGQMDNGLRAGSEYTGLLKKLKIPLAAPGQAVRTAELDLWLLLETARDELETTVAKFQPDVIHFICHGENNVSGNRILLTKRDPKTARKTRQPEYCSANTLLGLITRQDPQGRNVLPQIVVLNACHTATTRTTPEELEAESQSKASGVSFAATLAGSGVPVVIGMAGEVADGACRLFTLRFYQALIAQESVSLATAGGRRAAMLHYKDYNESVEWARPVLYLGKGADTVLQVDKAHQEAMYRVVEIADKYRELLRPGAFCDRFCCLEAYQTLTAEVASKTPRKILIFAVTETGGQFGKTRLLEEIAARSVLQGFVPVLLRSTNSDPPTNPLVFALQLAEAMDKTRKFFTGKKKEDSAALQLSFRLANKSVSVEDAFFAYEKDRVLKKAADLDCGPKAVRDSIVKDLRALLDDTGGRTPLVLLDDLQSYAIVAAVLLSKDMLDEQDVLGENGMTVPMVFTYSTVGTLKRPVAPDADAAIKKFVIDFDKYIVR